MAYPRLTDDGRCVVLDLHGVRLAEARPLVLRVVAEAARRGRAQVRLIHGSSTTEPQGARPTIKRMLHEMLETGAFAPHITQALPLQNELLLALDLTATPDPRPIRLAECWPR
ncbi:Smr/MutS family protein [Rhodothermus marinus]|uniref:Smr domain-containing protein n=1 Tax=Rhodothermus marinus (strain ATCC 43812 / DSM 4252 / R-10) TaxID=518766 RepID=D0MIE7_RHOM4|nr:Smr/MutS family protein [Rhodothermus marinus]ACY48255.1 hypothetical protein Rmar_1366 [Rhodothermus marinus DSM 4252]